MLKGFVSGAEKDIVRIPMKVGNEYKEGWEVRDNQDRLIWGREDELQTATGTLPFKGYALPVKPKSLLGNAVQNGTPTSDAPIMPDLVGVRSAQLIPYPFYSIDGEYAGVRFTTDNGRITANGTLTSGLLYYLWRPAKFPAGKYTMSVKGKHSGATIYFRDTTNNVSVAYIYGAQEGDRSVTFTVAEEISAMVYVNAGSGTVDFDCTIMLNAGEEAMPFEPTNGYKIPLTCAGQTTPVYLGQTQTVRKIKKLVLTGEEGTWQKSSRYQGSFFNQLLDTQSINVPIWCSHAVYTSQITAEIYVYGKCAVDGGQRVKYLNLFIGESSWSVSDFQQYLAAQYAAGTPVTVWYVLATPETAIVNEPLAKIGDYADELNDTAATLPEIPTTTGENTLTVDTTLAPSKLEVSVHAKKIHYGFKIDKTVSDSENAVIYTHDAVTMTPAYMDYSADRFNYGSWENSFFVRDCYPVALNLDGTEAYRLDPDDYTKKMDGTPSDIFYELLTDEPSDWSTQWKQYYTKSGDEYTLNSQSETPTFATDTYYKLTYNSSFTGNFMMAFPKVWFYRHEDSQYNYIEISNHRLSDDWKCYAHINASGQEVDFIYLPLFKGVIVNSKLRSLPGQIPQGGTTATTEANAATALGSRWQIWDHSSVECLNDLLTLMSKSIDSQGRFGQGRSTGYDSTDTVTYGKLQTGTLIKKGKFHGYSATTKEVKVFGLEGFWANRFDRLQGMLLVDNVWKIKMTPPYNFTGTDFVTLSNAEVPSGNGYLSKVQTSEYGSIPASIANGSSTKYFKDYFYKTATDTRVAIRGGGCGSGGYCGFRYVYVGNAASASGWNIGASPVYK